MSLPKQQPKIVIVSNRGPFSFSVVNGEPKAKRGDGGLVTAITSVVQNYDILWVSCALSRGDRQWLAEVGPQTQTIDDMQIRLLDPDQNDYRNYYNVISNPLLWFVQHQLYDAPRYPIIDRGTRQAWSTGYAGINRQLAATVAESLRGYAGPVIVMVQDYQLYLVPQFLRELLGDRVYIHFFLHIPWPGPDAWAVFPMAIRRQLLLGLLNADRVGFQTARDTRRFLQTCVENLPEVRVTKPWRQLGLTNRTIDAQPYPISVDVAGLRAQVATPRVQQRMAALRSMRGTRQLILRVDRVEPSKNILRGLIAYRSFLNAYPEFVGKVYYLALLVPSRTEVTEYRNYLRDITGLAGEINATYGEEDWEPVRIMLGNNYERALAALSEYDVLFVNPLADGMNLVAKEGVVLNQRNGVLILSEQAGAAEELGDDALIVSPFDVYDMREALHRALTMDLAERQERAERLAAQVEQNTIHHWFSRQLADIADDMNLPLLAAAELAEVF